jgi:hypothetical protein
MSEPERAAAALRAAEDARRAERELLEARARIRSLEHELAQVRARHDALRQRRSVRLVTGLVERVRAVVPGIGRGDRRATPTRATTGTVGSSSPGRSFGGPGADPRDLPRHYRETLLRALHDPAGADGPFRIGLQGADSAATSAMASGLAARGFDVVPLGASGATGRRADAVIVAGPEVDAAALPVGIISIAVHPGADPGFDLRVDPGEDPAADVIDAIDRWLRATRVAIRVPAASAATAETWGDTHLARAFRDALRDAGWPTRLHYRSSWDDPAVGHDDVVLDLLGLHETASQPGAVRILWQISHPELARPDLYDRYDLAFVASDSFASLMAGQTAVPVRPLHQATDPERFHPAPDGPAHELLFIASWRPGGRRILEDLLPTERRLAVYGGRWTPERIDPVHLAGEAIPNGELAAYYGAASIVLNDHWAGMRREGFLSNRLYDASAAGAFVISDDVEGLEAEFDSGVVGYRDRRHLHDLIEHYLEHPAERRERSERARAAVLARHTFVHRARTFIDAVTPLLRDRAGESA